MMGNRLREILNKEGVTPYRIWKDLGIDQAVLSKVLNGKINLTLKNLEKIMDYLGYDILLVKREGSTKKGGKCGIDLQAKKFQKLLD
jgi:transcriptional regulator with XRE-family HTH domain